MRTTRLQLRLDGVEPPVLRVLDVPATSTLDETHLLLQAALGFNDTHLHEFGAGDVRYGSNEEDDGVADAATARLGDLPSTFTHDYDFGDSWSAAVEVLGAGGDEPGLVSGEGHEPQDDIGGAPGYLEALATGELRPFDAERIGTRVRRVVGRVPPGVRVVLDALAGGVKLTPQGRLPQKIVREIQRRYPEWHPFGEDARPAQREDDLRPLVNVHDLVRTSGLARVRHGVLSPTKAASDPVEAVRRLRAALPTGTFRRLLIEAVVGMLLVEGPQRTGDLVGELYEGFGFRWSLDGRQPLTEEDMEMALYREANLLRALGQVEDDDHRPGGSWRAGPEAGWWLPRTALFVPEPS